MNDRIRELIVSLEPDAFMTYKGYLYHSGDPKVQEHSDPEPLYTQQELVKFAELIVKECVIRAEREWIRNGLHTEHNQAVSKVIESIKQHFGDEE